MLCCCVACELGFSFLQGAAFVARAVLTLLCDLPFSSCQDGRLQHEQRHLHQILIQEQGRGTERPDQRPIRRRSTSGSTSGFVAFRSSTVMLRT